MSYNFLKEKSKARDVHINTNKHVGGETCRTPGPARQARSRLSAPAPGGSGGPGGAGASNGTPWTVWLRGAPEDGCLGQLTPRDRGQGAGPGARGPGPSCLLSPLRSVFQAQQTLLPSADSSASCHLKLN